MQPSVKYGSDVIRVLQELIDHQKTTKKNTVRVVYLVKDFQIVGIEDDIDVITAFAWISQYGFAFHSSCRCWDGSSGEESHGRNSPGMFRPFHFAGSVAEIRGCLALLILLRCFRGVGLFLHTKKTHSLILILLSISSDSERRFMPRSMLCSAAQCIFYVPNA